ncbi:MAG: surface-adhesin E family protein [Limnohabitans sp.]
MKKLFFIFFATVSLTASAEWVLVSKNEFGTNLYVDPNIKIKGNVRMFWHMQDLSTADSQGDMSYRGIWQYDCTEKLQRNMQVAAFKLPLAAGQKSEEAHQPSDWVPIGTDTSSQALLSYVCSL